MGVDRGLLVKRFRTLTENGQLIWDVIREACGWSEERASEALGSALAAVVGEPIGAGTPGLSEAVKLALDGAIELAVLTQTLAGAHSQDNAEMIRRVAGRVRTEVMKAKFLAGHKAELKEERKEGVA